MYFPANCFGIRYPTLEASRPDSSNRMGWCYGDLNIALLLYRAGKLFETTEYTPIADRIGLQSVDRKTGVATQCADTHFCHGSAGLAQFYKCLCRETNNPAYLKAYEHWIGVTIQLIDDELADKKYAANPVSILDGWVGVAFVLTDHVSKQPLNWANAFLL